MQPSEWDSGASNSVNRAQSPLEPRELFRSLPLRNRLLGGGVWATSAFAGTYLLNIAVSALAARMLTEADAGAFFLALSVVAGGSMIAQLGLNKAGVRLLAESIEQEAYTRVRQVVNVVALLGFLSALAVVLVSALPPTSYALARLSSEGQLGSVALLLGFLTAARTLGLLRSELFRGIHDLRYASVFQGLDWYALTGASLVAVWFVYAFPVTLSFVLWLTVLAWLPGLGLGWWILYRKVGAPQEKAGIKPCRILKMAWPFWLSSVGSVVLVHGEMWVAGMTLPAAGLALYGAAHRLSRLVSAPLIVVNAVIQPVIVELYANNELARLERSVRATCSMAALPAAGLAGVFLAGGSVLLSSLFGAFYAEAWGLLAIISIGQIVNVGVGPCSVVLMMCGHERVNMIISVAGAVLVLGIGAWMGTVFGAAGVATGAATGVALKNVSTLFLARALTGVWTHLSVGFVGHMGRGLGMELHRRLQGAMGGPSSGD